MVNTRPQETGARAFENFDVHKVGDRLEGLAPGRHVDLLVEAGLIPLVKPTAKSYELIIRSFETGQAGKFAPDELIKAGLIKADKNSNQGEPRQLEEVKHLTLRKSSEVKPGDKQANYKVHADGTIEQLHNPDKKENKADDEIVIDIDDGGAAEIRAISEKQKAAVRQMISYLEGRYHAAGMSPVIPEDLLRALTEEPQIPPPTARSQTSGYNGQRMSAPRTHMPAMPSSGYQPQAVGRTPHTDIAEARAFNNIGPTPEIKTPEAFKGFLDRVVAAVSGNEGGFKSINWNDNGAGISVGKAQWNQKMGELPSLMKHFHDADPQLFNQIFGADAQNMLNENFVRHSPITPGSRLGQEMAQALAEPKFQQVQMELLREKALTALTLAHKYGHGSELFVAEVADMGNQFGWGGVESCMRKANVANIQDEKTAIKALQEIGQDKWAGRVHRDTKLARLFSSDAAATT